MRYAGRAQLCAQTNMSSPRPPSCCTTLGEFVGRGTPAGSSSALSALLLLKPLVDGVRSLFMVSVIWALNQEYWMCWNPSRDEAYESCKNDHAPSAFTFLFRGDAIASALSTFVATFFWSWMVWYCVVKRDGCCCPASTCLWAVYYCTVCVALDGFCAATPLMILSAKEPLIHHEEAYGMVLAAVVRLGQCGPARANRTLTSAPIVAGSGAGRHPRLAGHRPLDGKLVLHTTSTIGGPRRLSLQDLCG